MVANGRAPDGRVKIGRRVYLRARSDRRLARETRAEEPAPPHGEGVAEKAQPLFSSVAINCNSLLA